METNSPEYTKGDEHTADEIGVWGAQICERLDTAIALLVQIRDADERVASEMGRVTNS